MSDRIGIVVAWVSLGTTVLMGGYMFGILQGQVNENAKAIGELRQDNRSSADRLTEIRIDVKDIRARFEILVPTSALQKDGK